MSDLLGASRIEDNLRSYLESNGTVVEIFTYPKQDSGNVSYGVSIGDEKFFVKTPGSRDDSQSFLDFAARARLLRNGRRVRCHDEGLPPGSRGSLRIGLVLPEGVGRDPRSHLKCRSRTANVDRTEGTIFMPSLVI